MNQFSTEKIKLYIVLRSDKIAWIILTISNKELENSNSFYNNVNSTNFLPVWRLWSQQKDYL